MSQTLKLGRAAPERVLTCLCKLLDLWLSPAAEGGQHRGVGWNKGRLGQGEGGGNMACGHAGPGRGVGLYQSTRPLRFAVLDSTGADPRSPDGMAAV